MIQKDLYDEISLEARYDVISYDKCGMSLIITKVHEEKSCCVSPNVASNHFEPTLQTTSHIQLVASCVTGSR